MLARKGLHRGVRNFGLIETIVQAMAMVDIWFLGFSIWLVESVAGPKTHHPPIGLLQHWLAIEAIVDRWHETPKNQGNYTHIVHLITEATDLDDGQ